MSTVSGQFFSHRPVYFSIGRSAIARIWRARSAISVENPVDNVNNQIAQYNVVLQLWKLPSSGPAAGLRRCFSCHWPKAKRESVFSGIRGLTSRGKYDTLNSTKSYADVAQSVEQLIRNQQVAGSSPAISSKKAAPQRGAAFLALTVPTLERTRRRRAAPNAAQRRQVRPSAPRRRKLRIACGGAFLRRRCARSAAPPFRIELNVSISVGAADATENKTATVHRTVFPAALGFDPVSLSSSPNP